MKKLSVSLFAILAIAFAVTSAFTTKTAKTLTNQYAVVGVTPDVLTSSANSAAIESNIGTDESIQEVMYDSNTDITSILSNDDGASLVSWLNANPKTVGSDQYKLVCQSDLDNICAAYIDRTNSVVKSFKIGDADLQLQ